MLFHGKASINNNVALSLIMIMMFVLSMREDRRYLSEYVIYIKVGNDRKLFLMMIF